MSISTEDEEAENETSSAKIDVDKVEHGPQKGATHGSPKYPTGKRLLAGPGKRSLFCLHHSWLPPDDLGDLLDHARHERRSSAEGEREG